MSNIPFLLEKNWMPERGFGNCSFITWWIKGLVILKTGYPVGVSFGFRPDFFVPLTGLMNIFVPLNFFRLYFAPLKLSFIPLKSSLQIFRPLKSDRINFRPLKSDRINCRLLRGPSLSGKFPTL